MHSNLIAKGIAKPIANALAKRCLCDSNVSVIASASVRGSFPRSSCLYWSPVPVRHLSDVPTLATAGAGK